MSPLACSLLALATLLVAAEAQSGACGDLLIGKATSILTHMETVEVPPGGGQITVPDYCDIQSKGALVGEYVKACNKDTQGGLAPIVQASVPGDPHEPVNVICPDACPSGVTAYIVQYCQ